MVVEWWMGDGGGWTVVARERHRTRGHLEAAKARHSGIDAAALGQVARVWATVAAAKGVALLERHALGAAEERAAAGVSGPCTRIILPLRDRK